MVALRRMRSTIISGVLVTGLALFFTDGLTFFAAPARAATKTPVTASALVAAGNAMLLASVPEPAHAGGMFDFGLDAPYSESYY
mmetsp:Transcript_990/g.1087  ORF Transcript_990/g.1087 Transcript_990/m.1087 type:complete len:84 (+) Transcript_990:104-355(+)